jgi:hypothetical protein
MCVDSVPNQAHPPDPGRPGRSVAAVTRLARILAIAALVLVARAVSPPAATAAEVEWARPVAGAPVRAFAYDPAEPFLRGGHRGVDLAATPGATVRAACGGRVVTARPGQVVTLRCGPWRVTHLPMAGVTVHAGRRVAPGERLGTVGTSSLHRGLHVGVRRAGDRFAYVDPLAFLPARAPRVTFPPPPGERRRPATPARRLPPAAERRRPVPVRAPPARRPAPARVSPASRPGVRVPGRLAPWPAWLGLALVLGGALGGGMRVRARRVRARARAGEAVA